jgi:YfiH family protein
MISSPLLSTFSNVMHAFGTRNSGILPIGLVTAQQVHGTEVLFVHGTEKGEHKGFDILMTDKKGIAVGVKTADCLPILMVEPNRGLVAAVHAGWRGTAARVVEKAVQKIALLGGRVENLAVSLGPCIGGLCYEVEKDVVGKFQKEFSDWPEFFRRKSEMKWLLNLAEANRRQLLLMGIKPERIDKIDLCTHCRPDLFHSWRREGERAGRAVSFVQLL